MLSVGAALQALIGIVGEFRNLPGGDAASMLYGAARILDGARLYTDLIDLNPPFTFLFHTVPVLASRVLHVDAIFCFRFFVCALVAIAGITLLSVVRRAPPSAGVRHALIAGFLLGSLGLVVGYFGEREHLQFVLIFPYVALASVRTAGAVPSWRLSAWTGVLAGVGLALKVTAGLVPFLVGAVVWFGGRRRSDESLWALGALLLCTMAGLAWAPGYLHEVRKFGALYHGFSLLPFPALLFHRSMLAPLAVAPILLLLAWPVMRFRLGVLTWYAAVAGFATSVLVQGKGFPYHFLPAQWATLTVLLLVLASGGLQPGKLDALRRALAGVAVLTLLAVPMTVAWWRASGSARATGGSSMSAFDILRELPAGTTIAIHSSRLGDAFPLVNVRGLQLTGRFPHLWFMYPYDSSASGRLGRVRSYSDSALTPVERRLRHAVAEDLLRGRPQFLVVRDSSGGGVVSAYLCDDTLYQRAARPYRKVRDNSVMRLFVRDTTASTGVCVDA
jgi:hypothetical protein